MNPVPVIVMGVSAEPARTKEGMTVVIAGTGFAGGGGGGGLIVPVGPPPQPAMSQMEDRAETARAHAVRFIDALCI
jgi:hypothetical protein